MQATSKHWDFVVAGGGVLGLQTAIQWKRKHPEETVLLLEKDPQPGLHASGRNSGVLHAGFYYSADSLKARFSRDGNRALRAYCEERKLPINPCGKLVVARNEGELSGLDELYRRAEVNGVRMEKIDEAQAREIEPRIKTHTRALWSPDTATVDPKRVMAEMAREAQDLGVEIWNGTPYRGRGSKPSELRTGKGLIHAGYFVNAAGVFADRVAAEFGFGDRYHILPFKGLYLYSNQPAGEFKTNIYPVPNLANPFLGVHFTLTVDGKAKIGPTATPAFWREHYQGLEGFSFKDLVEVVSSEIGLFFSAGFDFRGLALAEIRKYYRPHLVGDAAGLATGVELDHYTIWGKPGIRAQLLDKQTRKLVMDFVVEGDDQSFHILNAISPAFTCSIPFVAHCIESIEAKRGSGQSQESA